MKPAQHDADFDADYRALRQTAGLLDLGSRSRLCLVGADRQRFLHGQVTNEVAKLQPGRGCYAFLVTAKGRIQSDLNIYCLADELLLDFEPGLASLVQERLEKYVIADDVQVVDATPHYGLLSVQGPLAAAALASVGVPLSADLRSLTQSRQPAWGTDGEVYCMNHPCGAVGAPGFDLFIPVAALPAAKAALAAAVQRQGGRECGEAGLEVVRVEAGRPRFGRDMEETNLAPEAGLEAAAAISYQKGCYIGQEVIARIRTYGQVNKSLRGLRLPPGLAAALPAHGTKLFREGREVGYVTTAVNSPLFAAPIALGYVRRECNEPGTVLDLQVAGAVHPVEVSALPFVASPPPLP